MATRKECERAIGQLCDALEQLDPEVRRNHLPERQLSLVVTDLDLAYVGRLDGDGLHGVVPAAMEDAKQAHVRFTATSDDLVAIGRHPPAFPGAWIRGRVAVHASFRDLLELRRLL
ncbi:MAG TPA: hypothetical protein VNG13_05695 [Mycobacteriales bacterium]|nr:hypothetical protein [Mycobacteriales bacterium]